MSGERGESVMDERVLRYWCEFRGRGGARGGAGALWRIEIYRRGGAGAEGGAREVGLAWSEGAVIEWGEVGKLDPVQGSSLTLRLISERDREFTELYSTDAGEWEVDVLRDGGLYWRGWIDTELYEEPYSSCGGYEVSVSASDFGAMDRADFGGSGVMSLKGVLDVCLGSCGLGGLRREYGISTSLDGGTPLDLGDVWIASDNFYDEDGEAMSCREVAEGILRPLGLRMVQRDGAIHIFDLNHAWSSWGEEEIYWSSDDSTMGVDRTYNRVRVKLSTYSDASGCDGSAEAGEAEFRLREGEEIYYVDPEWVGEKLEGFRLEYGVGSAGGLLPCGECRLGVFSAEYSGSDCAAAVWQFKGGGRIGDSVNKIAHTGGLSGHLVWDIINPVTGDHGNLAFTPIIKVGGRGMRIVGSGAGSDGRRYSRQMLKVSLELLLDTRYNPYEGDMSDFDGMTIQTCIPARLTLCEERGGVLVPTYFYSNRNGDGSLSRTGSGYWLSVADNAERYGNMEFWVSYYSWDNFRDKSGLGGWVCNRKSIHDLARLSKADERRGDGEYVPLPPASGYIMLEIGRGFAMRGKTDWYSDLSSEQRGSGSSEGNSFWGIHTDITSGRILSRLRWLCYRAPKVELVKANGKDAVAEDLQDSAWITPGAAESLDIDTIVGTPGEWSLPTSKALLLDGAGGVIRRMSRGGVTDRVERLLIGTAYSQYARRCVVLRGHCDAIAGMCTLRDASDPGGKYIMLGEVQDLAGGESEIVCAQYVCDDYEGIEITTGTSDE